MVTDRHYGHGAGPRPSDKRSSALPELKDGGVTQPVSGASGHEGMLGGFAAYHTGDQIINRALPDCPHEEECGPSQARRPACGGQVVKL
jgi:hypothetical protein